MLRINFALFVAILATHVAQAENPAHAFTSDAAVHIAGLPDVHRNLKGGLALTPDALIFTAKDTSGSIPRARIINVSIGDEEALAGGRKGILARMAIPAAFIPLGPLGGLAGAGSEAAFVAVTKKKVDLLTVEFTDVRQGYHGVVFELPSQQAAGLRDQLAATVEPPKERPIPACTQSSREMQRVLVAPITANGVELPAEYRVLLYEELFGELKHLETKRPDVGFVRAGDHAASDGCAGLSLQVTVNDFKKGNRALRAATGPVGFFVGGTSLYFDISLKGAKGESIVDLQKKKTKRGDSESLSVTDNVAKDIAKRVDQALR